MGSGSERLAENLVEPEDTQETGVGAKTSWSDKTSMTGSQVSPDFGRYDSPPGAQSGSIASGWLGGGDRMIVALAVDGNARFRLLTRVLIRSLRAQHPTLRIVVMDSARTCP